MFTWMYLLLAIFTFIAGVLWNIRIFLYTSRVYSANTEGEVVEIFNKPTPDIGRPGYVSSTTYIYKFVTENGKVCRGEIRAENMNVYEKGDKVSVRYVTLSPQLLHTTNVRTDYEMEKVIARVCFIASFIFIAIFFFS